MVRFARTIKTTGMKIFLPKNFTKLEYRGLSAEKKEKIVRISALALLALLGNWQPVAAQAGKDGPRTVATPATVLNEYTTLTADAAAGATTITVASSSLNANGRFSAGLATGDLLLLMQPQGAAIGTADNASYGTVSALNGAGRYQLVEVAAAPVGASISLNCRLLSTFTTAGHAQVVRVPRYTTLSLGAGAGVTAPAWDGSLGGVVAIETTGAVTLASDAVLDVTALGFRGGMTDQISAPPINAFVGYRSASTDFGAEKGESIAGSVVEYDNLSGRYGRGAPANGGGGGNSHNAAGGGGANAAVLGTTYTGKGNPDRGPGNAYDAAWNLEVPNLATSTSSGGGRGGYSYSTTDQNALTLGPGRLGWGGDARQNKGGLGGRPVASSGRAFFGGGGGAGDSNDNSGTAGTAGGGFIYLVAGGTVSGGSFLADGGIMADLSRNDGAGGGGGGGSVVVNAAGAVSSALRARGGAGGSQGATSSNEAEGPGGGGGGGYVAYTLGSPSTDVSGGLNGITASPSLTEFLPNGATRGGAGRVESSACTALLCPAPAADVTTSISFGANPVPVNQAATINVVFANDGPDPADNVVRLVQLPPGLGVGAVTVTTASGTGSYDNGTGQVSFTPGLLAALASGANANATISFTPTVGRVVVSSSISTSTDEACQVGNNASGDNTLDVLLPTDLAVTLSGPPTATGASSVTYTATVQNISAGAGTADATGVVLTVQLPKALLATSFPAGASYDFNTGITTVNVGLVSRGAAALSYAFTFTLPNNTQPAAGSASATAIEPDPNAANNDGSAASMNVATTVSLPAGTGSCAGTTFDGVSPATEGLYAEYFNGYFNNVFSFFDSPAVPNLIRTEGNVDYTTDNGWGDLTAVIGASTVSDPNNFSARYRGYLNITTAGTYTFSLLSDNAAYVWLDNAARATTLVAANAAVQNPGMPASGGTTVVGNAVFLAAGPHPLLALYGESTGQNRMQISYSGPDTGGTQTVVSQTVLCNRQFSGPLPVQLAAFSVEAAGRAAHLSWRTATELRNDRFEVERSYDGTKFDKIAEVRGAGTSATPRDYAFADAEAGARGGQVYYRLRQVDVDGGSQYSPVRVLAFKAAAGSLAGFHLYPNPAQQRVTLELVGLNAAPSTVTLIDLAGRIVRQQVVAADANVPVLDLSALPTGVYQVRVEQQGQRYTQRLVHTAD